MNFLRNFNFFYFAIKSFKSSAVLKLLASNDLIIRLSIKFKSTCMLKPLVKTIVGFVFTFSHLKWIQSFYLPATSSYPFFQLLKDLSTKKSSNPAELYDALLGSPTFKQSNWNKNDHHDAAEGFEKIVNIIRLENPLAGKIISKHLKYEDEWIELDMLRFHV